MKAKVLLFAGAFALLLPLVSLMRADEPAAEPVPAVEEPQSTELNELPLHSRQDAVSQRFKRFERLLLQMAEYMRKTDPEQADLLFRAIGQSKSDRISGQMEQIAALLEQDQLGDALDREQQVIDSLQQLLDLLQSGERRDELRKEQERIRDLLKDLNVTIGKTKAARASNERGDETERAVDRQEIAKNSAQDLVDKIDGQDAQKKGAKDAQAKPGENSESKDGAGEPKEGSESDPKEGPDGDKKPEDEGKPGDEDSDPNDGKEPGDKKPGDQKPGDKKPGDGKPNEGDPKEGESSESKPSESKPSDAKPSDGKPSDGKSQPGESPPPEGSPSESQPASKKSESDDAKTPGRDEIARAIERMDRAIEELKKQNRDGASKEQSKALADLEEARAKLEEILRQLREEERELLLAALEARFAKMLQMQIQVNTGTLNLDKTPKDQWTSRHQARSRELAQLEDAIALEAVKALDLLKEEGSSIAFPEAIEQMRSDMLTVARNLEQSDVGELTQLIEKDIVEALGEMIDALQKEMEKNKDEKKDQPPGEEGQKQDPALVDKLAELKMLRALQQRINGRTKLLARQFRGEQAESEQVIQLLQDLARRQSRVQQTAYDLATGRNQ